MRIAIVGMGYVGIQLAVRLGRQIDTVGFDTNEKLLAHYRNGTDPTGEVTDQQLTEAARLTFSSKSDGVRACDIYIVAVPTPVDNANQPDFGPLKEASRTVGAVMPKGATVVYESTVYPGATEEICVPELEAASGMTWQSDFHVAYSPERINPGDAEHTLDSITKVVSADDEATLKTVSELYGSIVPAGIYEASSIQVAEAAKVIENTQRDLNIALVNEFALIFNRQGIDTTEVLEAAGSKWNFLPFRPGLVGGHCIGVDPYYLTHRAQMLGYHPEVVLAGRKINDGMGRYIASEAVKLMVREGIHPQQAGVRILGVTFKEDCADIRNSQVIPMIQELASYGIKVSAQDPLADPDEFRKVSGIHLDDMSANDPVDLVVYAVPHAAFQAVGRSLIRDRLKQPGVLMDVKAVFSKTEFENDGVVHWRL